MVAVATDMTKEYLCSYLSRLTVLIYICMCKKVDIARKILQKGFLHEAPSNPPRPTVLTFEKKWLIRK